MGIVLATGSPGKRREILAALPGVRFLDIQVPGVEETGSTYRENAILKAVHAARVAGHRAVADDSGLEIEAMGWGPGLLTHRLYPDARKGMEDILASQAGVPLPRRAARYVTWVAVADPSGEVVGCAQGILTGRVSLAPRGEHGFAFDPVFIPDGGRRTLGEIPPGERNALSHRAQAFLAAFANNWLETPAKGLPPATA